jgi:acetyltransferase-like isoleucine patch superfamily enzyme
MDSRKRNELDAVRVKSLFGEESGFKRKYKEIMVGDQGFWAWVRYEVIVTLFGWIPGAVGLGLRYLFFRFLFKKVGKKVVFGRNMKIYSPHKISIGDYVVFDDEVFLDAKGVSNQGIEFGNRIFVGQNTIIQTKNGDIRIEDDVNIGPFCYLASTNYLSIGAKTYVGPYCLLMSGGEHDVHSPDFGPGRSLPLEIGESCWLAAKVTVFQDCHVGDHAVVGAAGVVNSPIPPNSVAVGIPAKVIKQLPPQD